jgi:hypothetical protein
MKECPSCGEQIEDVVIECNHCGEMLDETPKARMAAQNGVPLYKRMLLGLLWTVVLYFVASYVAGAIVGSIAGGKDPDNRVAASARAIEEFSRRWGPVLLIGSVLLSTAGAIFSFLPGTRPKHKG